MAINQFVARNGIISLGDVNITSSLNVSGSTTSLGGFTGSLLGTSSYASQALTASYALNTFSVISGSNAVGTFTSQSTWTFNHALNFRSVVVQTYDSNYNQTIPLNVQLTGVNTAIITFASLASGYAIASVGGTSNVSGSITSASFATSASYAVTASYFSGSIASAVSSSYALSSSQALTASYASSAGFNFQQNSPSNTWTINHNLNNPYPLVQTYDSSNVMLIPQAISSSTNNTTIVSFSYAVSGYARVV